jgi:hypothetical protein
MARCGSYFSHSVDMSESFRGAGEGLRLLLLVVTWVPLRSVSCGEGVSVVQHWTGSYGAVAFYSRARESGSSFIGGDFWLAAAALRRILLLTSL